MRRVKGVQTMVGRDSINRKRLVSVLLLLATALFVMSFVTSASAAPFTITGQVVSIARDGKILTVDSGMTKEHLVLALGDGAAIMSGKRTVPFNDLKVGDRVTVRYHQKSDGDYVAEDIVLVAAPMS